MDNDNYKQKIKTRGVKIYVYIYTQRGIRNIDESFINLATETVVETVTEVVNSVTEAATTGKKI